MPRDCSTASDFEKDLWGAGKLPCFPLLGLLSVPPAFFLHPSNILCGKGICFTPFMHRHSDSALVCIFPPYCFRLWDVPCFPLAPAFCMHFSTFFNVCSFGKTSLPVIFVSPKGTASLAMWELLIKGSLRHTTSLKRDKMDV